MAKVWKNLFDRTKDGNRKEQRSFLRYAIIATAVMIIFLCVKRDNIFTWISSTITLGRQRDQMERLREENAALEQRILDLSSNKDSLEYFAREELLFAVPGDDVYLLKE